MSSIDLEEVRRIKRRLAEINAMDPATLQVTDKGVAVEVADDVREDWKFIGLSTFYFLDGVLQEYRNGRVLRGRNPV